MCIKSFELYEAENFENVAGKADLGSDYDMLNDLIFDGKLPKIPLRWMRTKYKLGVTAISEDGIEYVGISEFYEISRRKYLDVLAHEMIHVYMHVNNIHEKDPHGPKFRSIMSDINSKHPDFNIVKSDNAKDFNVQQSDKPLKSHGALIFDEDGKYSLVVVQERVVNDTQALDKFVDSLKNYVSSPSNVFSKINKLVIKTYISDHPELEKFKVKRSLSLNNLELYVVSDDIVRDFEQMDPVRVDVIKG
jgi:hypothetical protein